MHTFENFKSNYRSKIAILENLGVWGIASLCWPVAPPLLPATTQTPLELNVPIGTLLARFTFTTAQQGLSNAGPNRMFSTLGASLYSFSKRSLIMKDGYHTYIVHHFYLTRVRWDELQIYCSVHIMFCSTTHY